VRSEELSLKAGGSLLLASFLVASFLSHISFKVSWDLVSQNSSEFFTETSRLVATSHDFNAVSGLQLAED